MQRITYHRSTYDDEVCSVSTPIDASFINVDLELRSSEDLTPLEAYFGRRVFLLHCAETDDGFLLAAEPVIGGELCADPLLCIDHLLALIESLPPHLRGLWDRCSARRLSYGFDGGIDGKPFSTVIDTTRVARIAAIGAEIELTLYAYSAEPSEPAGADWPQRST